MQFVLKTWLLIIFIYASDSNAEKITDAKINYWLREAGVYANNSGPDIKYKTFDLSKIKSQKVELLDHQYFSKRTFQGYDLVTIIQKIAKGYGDVDMVLFHFENGMIIPLKIDALARKKLSSRIFYAVGIYDDNKKLTLEFPNFVRKDVFLRNYPPVKFSTNKLVVTGLKKDGFSPWVYVNSLSGVEFANAEKYFKQFEISTQDRLCHGQQVFLNRCQYCHGVTGVGAKYGWDFVTPLPLYKKRPVEELYTHVKYPKAYAIENGISMPSQKDVTKEEIADLWLWMEAITKTPLKKYDP